jgi:YYY domain-containing protein
MIRWLAWYAALQAVGLAALPLAWTVLSRLPDRGLLLAKPIGALAFGLTLWIGASHGLLRNDAGGALLALAAVALGGALAARRGLARDPSGRRPFLDALRGQARGLAWGELLFLLVFAGWTLLRAHDPGGAHSEQPMDLMLVNAASAAPLLPIDDPWLGGHALSYYYFGHWLLAALGRLAGQPPELAYNLGQASWLALLALGCFSVARTLALLDRRREAGACAAGLLAAVAVALAGNPQGTADLLQLAGADLSGLAAGRAAHNFGPPPEPWWWWRASRVINDVAPDGGHLEVIDEFPAFSYVLGDDHALVLAQPLVVLAVALALQLLLAVREPVRERCRLAGLHPRDLAAAAVLVAAVGCASPGDLPASAGLMLGAAAWSARGRGLAASHATLAAAAALAVGGLVVAGPFLVTLLSPAHGLIPNALHPTPLFQLLLMFGGVLPGIVLLAAQGPRPTVEGRTYALLVGLVLPVVAVLAIIATAGPDQGRALTRWGRTPFTLPALGALLSCLLARAVSPGGALARRAATGLAALGLGLVMVPEVVYLRDAFVMRMNTVFKLYYPAWLLLGLASAYAIAAVWRDGSPRQRVAARACALAATVGVAYTAGAAWNVTRGFSRAAPTLSALANLVPAERAAIDWVRAHVPPGAVVLQADGHDYVAEEGRLAGATGRPTLLGWHGHELVWRGPAFAPVHERRVAATASVYRAADADALRDALDAWGIGFVLVGPVERARFRLSARDDARFLEALDLAFESGAFRIYRRRPLDGRG